MILDFQDVPAKRRETPRARYVLSGALLIASGFFAMALLKPVIQHHQVAETATLKKAADSSADANKGADSSDQTQSDSTVVHNGVTVVTPRLLVPVVSDAAAAATEQSAALPNKVAKPTVAKTRTTRRSASTASRGSLTAPWFNPTKQVVH